MNNILQPLSVYSYYKNDNNKFIKFLTKDMDNYQIGLNTAPINEEYIEFTDLNNFMKKLNIKYYWVCDVEIPDGEKFTDYRGIYHSSNIILSNPRRLWNIEDTDNITYTISFARDNISDEFKFILYSSCNFILDNMLDKKSTRTFIARSNNKHELC